MHCIEILKSEISWKRCIFKNFFNEKTVETKIIKKKYVTKYSVFSLSSFTSLIRLLFLPAGEKHHMLPTGELLVFSVAPADAHSTYRCRTVHHVTGDTVESSSYARLVVTGKFSQDVRSSVELPRVEVWDSANAFNITQVPRMPQNWRERKIRS